MATATVAEPTAARAARSAAQPVVLERTARRAARSGVGWGALFGVVAGASAVSYASIYSTPADRARLEAAFAHNGASAALFGPARDLQTVAGFTEFKSFLTISILSALFGLLVGTRLLRGEEDAGRWELCCTGPSTPRGATLQALGGLAVGYVALLVATAVVTTVLLRTPKVDLSVGSSLFFAVAQSAPALAFLGLGALASQLAATRRRAAALAGWALGASYLLRMVADAGVGLHGLVWATPLGWAEQLQPLTSPQPLALLPFAALALGSAAAAVVVAGRRDVGSSLIPDHARAEARTGLLGSHVGLDVRLQRGVLVGWVAAIVVTGLVMGLVAKTAGASVGGSSVQEVFERLGAPGVGARAFLGVAFLIVAALVAFLAAGQVGAVRTEEAEGRLDQLLAEPLARGAWLSGRALVAAASVLVAGVVAGVATWLGCVAGRADVGLGTLLAAGLNVAAPALLLVGLGVLAVGAWPRRATAVVYGVLGWSLLVELVGGIGKGRRVLLDTSVFHQMAAAPAASPDWTTDAVMVVLGLLATAAGLACFARRDVTAA